METADGYLVCLQRSYLLSYRYWVKGKAVPAGRSIAGSFSFWI